MYYVYILRSLNKRHWYTGHTHNLVNRLRHHNNGTTKSTKRFTPWEIVYTEEYKTRSDAYKREMYLKSTKGYMEYRKIKEKIANGEFA